MAGRPREFDRDKALEKARDLFWSRGYEGTSLADLTDELGLAPARIYAAFGSKNELFRASIADYQAREGSFATRALEEEATARRAIERMLRDGIRAYFTPGKPRGCMVVAAATNCAKSNVSIMSWLAEQRLARIGAIAERLSKGMISGELRSDTDPQLLADYYAAILNGMSVQARDGIPRKRLIAIVPNALLALNAAIATFAR